MRLPSLILIAAIALTGCLKDSITHRYTFYRPLYRTTAEVRANIKSNPVQPIHVPGKLFYKDGFVYLNELDKGVHIIDISIPAAPRKVAFVDIPGCVDIAVRGNILYADLYIDLVALDISNPAQVKVAKIIDGVFPHRYYGGFTADTSKVIIDWERVDTIVKDSDGNGAWGLKAEDMRVFAATTNSGGGQVTNGIGGSMARFALASDRLYTVSYNDLKAFNVNNPADPFFVSQTNIASWRLETIFPFKSNLFIGASDGMYICDISEKDKPRQVGKFTHARVCDPVVANDNYAYVTLRDGTKCQGFINQLDVVDIKNLFAPSLVKSYPLTNPHGLAIDGNLLLICDGRDGLRVMDATHPNNVTQLGWLKGLETYDVIALGGTALAVATDGLYLVDYNNPAVPAVLSKISIANSGM
jgi:hypothetical protein